MSDSTLRAVTIHEYVRVLSLVIEHERLIDDETETEHEHEHDSDRESRPLD